jgi:NADH:ubiquinone oxidoreductase subunit F (NADH-binding)
MIIAAKAMVQTAAIFMCARISFGGGTPKAGGQGSQRSRFLGRTIFGSTMNFDMIIMEGAGAFVCGRKPHSWHPLKDDAACPYRNPLPGVKGLFGKPTVINNVET